MFLLNLPAISCIVIHSFFPQRLLKCHLGFRFFPITEALRRSPHPTFLKFQWPHKASGMVVSYKDTLYIA